uniref:Uncharacterized protein n=1 Tax=Anguilla anguilla TaxID=7936 RepID=A0A0E9WT13_ANGAN
MVVNQSKHEMVNSIAIFNYYCTMIILNTVFFLPRLGIEFCCCSGPITAGLHFHKW